MCQDRKKKYKIKLAILLAMILVVLLIVDRKQEVKKSKFITIENGVQLVAKTKGDKLQTVSEGVWQNTFLKGVNMGAAKPGYYPGEFGITKKDYLRWFKQIAEMNANVIRVYTLQMPIFYEALYEYNSRAEKPLYLIQGVWVDEEEMLEEMDAFSPKVYEGFKNELIQMIDVLHGNKEVTQTYGKAYGHYQKDVSPYVLAYILGTEWDPYFVSATNEKNEELEEFEGTYIYTEGASPIEIFFANTLEAGIQHESETYQMQKPMAITNWVTTDWIDHSYDVEEANRIGSIDVEHIKAKDSYQAGLFASYHVYPYYPDLFNYESPYIEPNEEGEVNSYRAYLEALKVHHSIPVVVSEFGIPTSRGISHKSQYSGYNQGMVDETEQGEMLVSMSQDIYETGYAGAVVFSWQDEWFKRTWNTMLFDDENGRPYWLDTLTNEQCFGLLAFDPGEETAVSIDGDLKEWKAKHIISEDENIKLFMQSDEAYLYFAAEIKDLDLGKEEVWLPINVTPLSGANVYEDTEIHFEEGVDFIIQIEDANKAQVLVQDYYDATRFLEEGFRSQNLESGHFEIYSQTISREANFPLSGETLAYEKVEVGRLHAGYSDPTHEAYRSLTDFNTKGDVIEIRIPWLMLNVSNPAQKLILSDFQRNGTFSFEIVDAIRASVYRISEKQIQKIPFGAYNWHSWEMPTYHERLKPAYEAVKEIFSKLT